MPRLNFLRFLSVRATVCLFAISGAVASASNESAPFQLDLRLSLAEWADAAGVPLGDAQPTLIAGPLGVANLVAYGLGLDPMVGDPKDLPAIALDPINTNLLVYTYTLNRDSVGVSMIIEQSQDFVSWQEIVPVSDVLVEELSEGVERRVVRIERDLEKPAGFFRIRVEESP